MPRWYRRHKRNLPWRQTRDPYAIWVSEIMLQQTRVETVIPYYQRWLRAFPTIESLARAPLSRVLRLWEGLGYYHRARHLHRAARQLVSSANNPNNRDNPNHLILQSGQSVERSFQSLAAFFRRLPGVGRYTAGAIASIAFDERAALVDGNVARVLARVFNIRANVKRTTTQRRLWALAEALLPARGCGEFNQALMELGALVCLPSSPRCEECPLRRVCKMPGDTLPNRGPKRRMTPVTQDVVWMRRDGKIRLCRRPAKGLLAGLWELPPRENGGGQLLLTLRHTIMNRRITLRVFAGDSGAGQWVSCRSLARRAMPVAHRRAVTALLSAQQ